MDETGRGTPADLAGLESLTDLDDDALREIAYGRAVSETDRMRADRATRILMSRNTDERDPVATDDGDAPPESSVAATAAHSAIDTAALAPAPARGFAARRIGAALLVTGLVIGAGLGVGIALGADRFLDGLQPDAMGVFDRDATAEEIAVASDRLGVGNGQARVIATIGDVQVYGMSTSANVWSASGYISAHVCVTATAPNTRFPIVSCMPELIFREAGIRAELSGVTADGLQSAPELTRVITVEWGPRGEPTVEDRTGDFVVSSDDG